MYPTLTDEEQDFVISKILEFTKSAILPLFLHAAAAKEFLKRTLKNFAGKPIIAYSIEAAIQSNLFDEIMVSTDDEEIAEVAKQYGAKIPFKRSEETSNDFAILNDVIMKFCNVIESEDKRFDYGCCILSTAPFITTKKLKEAFDMLVKNNFDSVRPIVKFSYPIQRAFKLLSDNTVEMFDPEHFKTRSQDLEPAYHDAGQFYWFKTDKTLSGNFKGGMIDK